MKYLILDLNELFLYKNELDDKPLTFDTFEDAEEYCNTYLPEQYTWIVEIPAN